MRSTIGRLAAAMLALALAGAAPGVGAAQPVDVELVLAADGSGSIDRDEFRTQREGYAAAITHPDVLGAIQSGPAGAIALAYTEWGGVTSHHTIVDWMVIRDEASARAFAERLLAGPRKAMGYNSISGAIDYAAEKIRANGFDGVKQIIDISGDGPQIGGPRPVEEARDDAVAAGMIVNALAVKRPGGTVSARLGEPLEDYYGRAVIGGPGSFVLVADERTSFADAVRRKLILEMAHGRAR